MSLELLAVTPLRALEMGGSMLGVIGTILLAMNTPMAKWAWPIWLLSTAMLCIVTHRVGFDAMAAQQFVYSIINVVGCWRWIVRPMLDLRKLKNARRMGARAGTI